MKNFICNILFLMGICLILSSCDKEEEFLNAKPVESLSLPNSVRDIELLMHNEGILNHAIGLSMASTSTDEFYVPYSTWQSRPGIERNTYIFAKGIYNGDFVNDWNRPYECIYYANTALYYLQQLADGDNSDYVNEIRGTALFFRAHAFYNLVQTFAMPFDKTSSNSDLGIPLKLSPDLNEAVTRQTVSACYEKIIADLKEALPLLPDLPRSRTSPSKISTNAMLARVMLATFNFEGALQYSDACLKMYSTLVDYNELTPSESAITSDFAGGYLAEDIFHCTNSYFLLSNASRAVVDSVLYDSYDDNDLRKSLFFRLRNGIRRFKGTYDLARSEPFGGIATDEVFLIRAEANARLGFVDRAMSDVNALLVRRYKVGTFVPLVAANAEEALVVILNERKKELCFRGLRWMDLRRLNKEPRFAMDVVRNLDGQVYTLPANSNRYAMPIPDDEIRLSGLPQNER